MNTLTTPAQASARLDLLGAMGVLLERLEQLPRSATAAQYRAVVLKVQSLLSEAEPGPTLNTLLAALPATAELYENQHYAHAGLCRSAMDAALGAERAARAVLAKSASLG